MTALLHKAANRLRSLFWRAWSRLVYAPCFGRLGPGSVIVSPAFLDNPGCARIGADCAFQSGLWLQMVRRYAGKPHSPRFEVGDRVTFNAGVYITCAESITIGDDVHLGTRVSLTDIVHPHGDLSRASKYNPLETRPVVLRESCIVYNNAVILPGVTVGRFSVVGANSVVTRDVPDYAVVGGAPAKVLKVLKEAHAP